MASLPNIIAWDYQFAPNAQKSRNYLHITETPFKICEQPFVLPRPILTNLGIEYRRVPVLSIGKDVFCDNSCFLDAIQHLRAKHGAKPLAVSGADRAFEAWGYRTFWAALPCVPANFITPALAKDRANLFPVFAREDFASLHENGLSEVRAMMDVAENEYLSDKGAWIGGSGEPGMADVHAVWMIKWALQTLEIAKEPGFGEKEYPRVHRWITSIPALADAEKPEQHLSADEASKQILSDSYAVPDLGIDATDPLQLKEGEQVAVEANDAKPGTYPQPGKLVGLSKKAIVVQLENGLRVHFPRVGYAVFRA